MLLITLWACAGPPASKTTPDDDTTAVDTAEPEPEPEPDTGACPDGWAVDFTVEVDGGGGDCDLQDAERQVWCTIDGAFVIDLLTYAQLSVLSCTMRDGGAFTCEAKNSGAYYVDRAEAEGVISAEALRGTWTTTSQVWSDKESEPHTCTASGTLSAVPPG